MSEIARSTILRGPGYVTWDSATIHTTGDINATPELSRFDIVTSRSGVVDSRVDDLIYPVSLTPTGEINSTLLGKFFPAHFSTPAIGKSIFGASAKPLVVVGVNYTTGNSFTLEDAALTKMPSLRLSAGAPVFGDLTFTGLRKDDTAWTDAASMLTLGNATPATTDSDPAETPTEPYEAVWGSLLTSIETETGWTVDFSVGLKAIKTDRQGTLDLVVDSVGVMAKCTPVGATMANIVDNMMIQGTGVTRGASTRGRSADLVLTGTALVVTLKNAALVTAGHRWGNTTLRHGEIGFVANRSYATGAYGALFSVAEPS